jgi:transcriptional regulatory protein RtcR
MLRKADKGVLFLDEIGELGLDEQAMLLRAIEDRRFLPVGSDREVDSDFQLIAGTNRDLSGQVLAGRFREDLLARMNLWTFRLPGLRERAEDIAPNLEYELDQFARRTGRRVTLSREARERFLTFAESREATWNANFRDLSAAITRMATLASGGRISKEILDAEVARLKQAWRPPSDAGETRDHDAVLRPLLGARRLDQLDLFDRVQLAAVIATCRECPTLSEAGRRLFHVTRGKRKVANDADRLRKYLARFDLEWGEVKADTPGPA